MSFPNEFHMTFTHKEVLYDVDLVKNEKSDHSVRINGVEYAILGDSGNLKAASEILNSVSLESVTNPDELKGRLTLQGGIVFKRSQKMKELSEVSLKTNKMTKSQETSQLIRFVENIQSDTDIKILCNRLLSHHNNDAGLALDHLKELFRYVGRGPVSERVSEMLIKESSNRNVDEIKAFGRDRTVDVVSFLKRLPRTEEGAIDLTQMKKIGQGGTQDVYSLKEAGGSFVIKVIRASLKMNDNERFEKYTIAKAAYQKLHDAFGNHCTVEQLLLRTIDDGVSANEALVSVAAFEEGYSKQSKIGLNAPFFEWEPTVILKNLNNYEKVLKSLFISGLEGDFDTKLLKENMTNPGFIEIARLVKDDSGFRNAMREFLSEFKEYFNKTGQYLDIAGLDNIIFFQDNSEWVFRLGTVIKSETAQKFKLTLEKIQEESKSSDNVESDNLTFYCFHWTKTLNMLGMMVGMGNIIDDDNTRKIASMWNDLKKTGVMGIPADPVNMLNVLEAAEKFSAEELAEKLKELEFNPEKDTYMLVGIVLKLAPEKKQVVALHLHNLLPKAGDPIPNCKYCPVRYQIGMDLKNYGESKDLALACLNDVLLDPHPNAPHEEVKSAIKDLL